MGDNHKIIMRFARYVWLLSVLSLPVHAADFLLNFSRPNQPSPGDFGPIGSITQGSCDPGTNCDGSDGTAFSQQVVNIKGVDYWRNVVGDPATGFAVEYYTRASSGLSLGGSPDTGGHENSLHDGLYGGDICRNVPAFSAGNVCGNATDPLNINNPYTYSGTGTADPSKVVMRMVLSGDGMDMEVYKPVAGKKPLISQTVVDGTTRMQFAADLRDISFTDKDTPVEIVNKFVTTDPGFPQAGMANFEMSMAERSHVTAGQFTFTPGTGWNSSSNWNTSNSSFDEGTYDYGEDNFDVYAVDWGDFFNYSDNQSSCNSQRHSPCPGAP